MNKCVDTRAKRSFATAGVTDNDLVHTKVKGRDRGVKEAKGFLLLNVPRS